MGLLERLRLRKFRPTPLGEILDPSDLRRMTTQELARYKASWTQGKARWLLADIEQRRREAWSGPVKLSLGFSALALVFSAIALLKS